jgi:hypothetical protein
MHLSGSVIQAKILTGRHVGSVVYIRRIYMNTDADDKTIPVQIRRHQYVFRIIEVRPLRHYLSRGDPWTNDGVSMFYLLRQLYSLDRVTQMWDIQTMDSYYGVVYLRPDLMFQVPLPLSTIVELRQTLMANDDIIIYTPGFDATGGLNDRFAIGHPAAMRAYGRRMRDIEDYYRAYPTGTLWSEPF